VTGWGAESPPDLYKFEFYGGGGRKKKQASEEAGVAAAVAGEEDHAQSRVSHARPATTRRRGSSAKLDGPSAATRGCVRWGRSGSLAA
jgi:hypothetical protein